MRVEPTELPEVLVIEPRVHHDARGYFFEAWQRERYVEHGLPASFAQDNVSFSRRGVLRGLHYQWPHPQGKLIGVLEGEIWDVAVDIRKGSARFGRWVAVPLTAEGGKQLWIPEGFAHGFVVTSESALVSYKCTVPYAPGCEHTLLWNDPELSIPWPVEEPVLSGKDREGVRLGEIPAPDLPGFAR